MDYKHSVYIKIIGLWYILFDFLVSLGSFYFFFTLLVYNGISRHLLGLKLYGN